MPDGRRNTLFGTSRTRYCAPGWNLGIDGWWYDRIRPFRLCNRYYLDLRIFSATGFTSRIPARRALLIINEVLRDLFGRLHRPLDALSIATRFQGR